MTEIFFDPFMAPFMQRALFTSIIIASVCATFSCFLILKGWALMGDAVAHAVLPGLALSVILKWPLALGAFLSGLFCALASGFLKDHSRIKEDTAMGIMFSGLFALGLVMLSKMQTGIHMLHILYGNILGVTPQELIESAIIASMTITIILFKRKDLMLVCFDTSHAKTLGMPVKFLEFMLLILLALTIVSALKAAGIIMVIAMLIAPGATGFLLTRSFDTMLIIAVISAIFSAIIGTIISFHADIATAPLIVLIQSFGVLIAGILGKVKRETRHA